METFHISMENSYFYLIFTKKYDKIGVSQLKYDRVHIMKQQNICKFPIDTPSESLSTHCFVYEADPNNLRNSQALKYNRMILVSDGQCRFEVGGHTYDAKSGSLLFIFEREVFSLTEIENPLFLYLDFSGGRARELFKRFGINREKRLYDGFGAIIPFWKESLARASEDTVDLAAESVLLHTISRMKTESAKTSGIVSEMIEIMESNFNDPTLSISTIAEALSYNPKYISHIFKKEMGMGYSEYLRDLRLNYARGLFDHGLDSIKNVALLSGFNDPLYFSSVFKGVVGLSPKEYISGKDDKQS